MINNLKIIYLIKIKFKNILSKKLTKKYPRSGQNLVGVYDYNERNSFPRSIDKILTAMSTSNFKCACKNASEYFQVLLDVVRIDHIRNIIS